MKIDVGGVAEGMRMVVEGIIFVGVEMVPRTEVENSVGLGLARRFSRFVVAYELLVLSFEMAKFFLRWTDWADWPDLVVFDVEEGTGMVRFFVLKVVLSWVG